MLTEEDKSDRFVLRNLFHKRKFRSETKEGFFNFENQKLMIAEGRETYVVVSGDMAVGFPLFMRGESDFSKFEDAFNISQRVRERSIDTLWDVGANIGPICIPAVKRNFVKRAVAFEPEKNLFKLLRANVILNEVDDRITLHNTALGEATGTANLTMGDGNTGDYRILGRLLDDDQMGEAGRRMAPVQILPMDDFSAEFAPSSTLIFMDIQGYEGIALRGARAVLSSLPPLVAEFWPYAMKRLSSYEALRDVVCDLYSEFVDLTDSDQRLRRLDRQALDSRYAELGEDSKASTDLLFL